ncbi:hypothetical protein AB6809_29950 [Paraburkholderia sp. RCC_158]|uniref:hypothetical protein n=1 Tax=Paraburkholderia sp. RCC_158 TaxID=3239220 RepID=UPI003523B216
MSHTPFYGSELTVADCEMLALTRVDPALRVAESLLFTRKWFDYRGHHPVQATYLFAHEYAQAVRRAYAQQKDVRKIGDVKGFDVESLFESRELTAMWRARQAFDAIGCRYEYGLDFIMKRFCERGWRVFPRPNQLYAEEVILDVRDAWNAHCKAVMQLAKHERFLAPNFAGHPDQIAYQSWQIAQVKTRGGNRAMLIARLLQEHVLTEQAVAAEFGDSVLAQAKRFVL